MSAPPPEPVDSLLARVRRLPGDTLLTRELTAARLCAEVDALAASLAVEPGEPVGYRLPNGEPWAVGFLGLLHAGATPLLIAPEAPRKEVDRLLTAAGARRELIFDGRFRLDGESAGDPGARGVLLATSGTTGAPKLVLRTENSLLAEADRYRGAAGLDGHDRLVLPLPLTHAYALGWLAAALVTGTQVLALAPTALSAVATELADGATILALVPTVARLLALRAKRKPIEAPKLRLAMVGAGPVDERLEADFQAAFGISTGRNYGSTETGALFAGLADLPPLCVGQPMAGVRFRLVEGQLEVATGEDWHATGDLAVADEQGRVTVLGRRHGAVRKGGRWVAPAEVESVLREHPQVRDVHVRARRGRFADEDSLIADVVVNSMVDEARILDFARERLSAYKVPERVYLRRELERTATGKVVHTDRRYRLGPEAVEAMRAYRRSELLFALADLGVLDLLGEGADAETLADELSLPVEQLRWLLDIAVDLGVLGTESGEIPAGFTEMLGLEVELSRTWLTRRAIVDAVAAERPFDTASLGADLPVAYRAAMHGPHTAARTRLGLRLLGRHARGRVLEVTAGPGRYLAGLAELDGCHLTQVGRLAGPSLVDGRVTAGDDPPAGVFDAVIVANAIHGPGPGADPGWLLDRLAPGGVLLVDDLFLPAGGGPGAELGLDWLTHGGTAWPRLEQWQAGLTAAGGSVVRTVRLTPPECCLILAKEES
jgi:long-chain acyl-CoA synthetase